MRGYKKTSPDEESPGEKVNEVTEVGEDDGIEEPAQENPIEVKPRLCFSTRLFFAVIAFLAVFNLTFLRVGVSMALVCITIPEDKGSEKREGDYNWNSATKGYIISAAFYGFLIGPFVGGILSFKIGGKLTLIISSLGCSLLHFIIPPGVRIVAAFMAFRVAVGFLAGFTFPSVYELFSHWITLEERQLLVTAALLGIPAASIVNFPFTGFLCESFGWAWLFYIFAAWLLIFGTICIFFLFNYPEECPYISREERSYLQTRIPKAVKQTIPWKHIVRSLPIYAYIVIHFCVNYVYLTMVFSLPVVMENIYHFSIHENGLLSALPFIGSFIVRILMSVFFEQIRKKLRISKNTLRKAFVFLGAVFTSVFFSLVIFIPSHWYWALTCFVLASTSLEFCLTGGYLLSLLDLCPSYVNVLTGVANAIANAAGLISPVVNGLITTHGTKQEWNAVFYVNISIILGAMVFYLVFGRNEVQHWALAAELNNKSITRAP